MNSVFNLMQTLAIGSTLMLILFVLGWMLYAFRRFVILFNQLMEELEKPRVCVHSTVTARSEEHTSELQSLMRISYAVFCLKKNILYAHSTIAITRLHIRQHHLRHQQ